MGDIGRLRAHVRGRMQETTEAAATEEEKSE